MIHNERKRQSRTLSVERLESRNLLNAAVLSHSVTEVQALRAPTATVIRGTIHATITSTTPSTTDPFPRTVTYSGQGNASFIGQGPITGQHTVTSSPFKNTSTDTYTNGTTTLTAARGVVDASYTGSGRTNANGRFTATLRGTASGDSGLAAGHSGSFVAQLSGNKQANTFTITFTIKA